MNTSNSRGNKIVDGIFYLVVVLCASISIIWVLQSGAREDKEQKEWMESIQNQLKWEEEMIAQREEFDENVRTILERVAEIKKLRHDRAVNAEMDMIELQKEGANAER